MNTSENARRVVEAFAEGLKSILGQASQKGWTEQNKEQLKARLEELRKSVEVILHAMHTDKEWNWGTIGYEDISNIKRSCRKKQPVIVRASVESMTDVACLGGQDYVEACLKDALSPDSIRSTMIMEPLLSRVQELSRRHAALDFLGFSVLIPTLQPNVEAYAFVIVDVRAPHTPVEIVMASPGEVCAAQERLDALTDLGQPPLHWLKDEATRLVGISGLADNPLMAGLLEVMVLQALSDGYVKNANGRIHSLVIGPPASGKKLMVSVAEISNVAFRHAGHKVTAAGLVGATIREGGRFSSAPGLLPLAHMGTVAFEDFHAVTKGRMADIVGHLSQFMEDGEVHDSTSAKMTFQANTSIHLDFNRASDLLLTPAKGKADVSIPMNIISRFDVVYDIPRDYERQLAAARAMIMNTEVVGPHQRHEQTEAIRRLQLLVAVLRTNIPRVEIPVAVRHYTSVRMDDLWTLFDSHSLLQDYLSLFQTRMVNSVFKLAAAHARGQGRSEADISDIDRAVSILRHKVIFLRSLVTEHSRLLAGDKQQWRKNQAEGHFGDEPFTPEDYAEATNTSRPTAYRDVQDFQRNNSVRKVGAGRYRFALTSGECHQ